MSATPDFVMSISDDEAVRGQILVNGLDIAESVVGVEISSTAKQSNVVLTLAPIRRPFHVELGTAAVTLDEGTHKLLVDLGWTPPTDPPGPPVIPTPGGPGPEQWETRQT